MGLLLALQGTGTANQAVPVPGITGNPVLGGVTVTIQAGSVNVTAVASGLFSQAVLGGSWQIGTGNAVPGAITSSPALGGAWVSGSGRVACPAVVAVPAVGGAYVSTGGASVDVTATVGGIVSTGIPGGSSARGTTETVVDYGALIRRYLAEPGPSKDAVASPSGLVATPESGGVRVWTYSIPAQIQRSHSYTITAALVGQACMGSAPVHADAKCTGTGMTASPVLGASIASGDWWPEDDELIALLELMGAA